MYLLSIVAAFQTAIWSAIYPAICSAIDAAISPAFFESHRAELATYYTTKQTSYNSTNDAAV